MFRIQKRVPGAPSVRSDPRQMTRMVLDLLHQSIEDAFPLPNRLGVHESPRTAPAQLVYLESSPYSWELNDELLRDGSRHIELQRAKALDEVRSMLGRDAMDAVLLDLTRPELATLEDVRQLRADHPDVPIIGLLADGQDRATAFSAGCDACLIKAFVTINVLDRAVQACTARAEMN